MHNVESSAGVRIYINKVMLSLFLVVWLIFSLVNFLNGHYFFLVIEGLMFFVTVFFVLFYERLQKSNYWQALAIVYTSFLLGLFSILLLSDNVSKSSFIWACLYPIATYTINGLRNGFWATFISLCVVFVVYLNRNDVDIYQLSFKELMDYMLVVLVIWLLTHMYEKKNVESSERLMELNTLDSLTNLKDRTILYQTYRRYTKQEVCLISLDIDAFQQVNDTYGYLAGDVILISIANILKKLTLSKEFFVFRTGGDEFAIFVPDADCDACLELTKTLYKDIIECRPIIKKNVIDFHISIALACMESDGNNLDELMAKTECLMKQAKTSRQNKIAC